MMFTFVIFKGGKINVLGFSSFYVELEYIFT